MNDTVVITPDQVDHGASPAKTRSPFWQRIALGGIMLVSIFLNFYQLGQNGYANTYYASGIRSMLDNLHNFFFVSFDPGGFVTIDKPPLGFWLQTLSAKLFGFTSFSILLPQALAGVLSVLLLYYLVRRHFGVPAGLLAALALAITPISVLTNRNNTIDSTLALTMLLGAWAVLRAAETGKLRWLLVCAALVGIGFNIKMAEAYLVIPAFGLLYLLASPRKLRTRIWHLALAVILMLTISLSWAVAVDLTPASARPYVGSTQDNSEISLAIGYNGIQRLLGNAFGGGNRSTTTTTTNIATQPTTNSNSGPATTANAGSPGGGGGGGFGTGTAGVLRLVDQQLGGQISWLLPMALLGILALAWQRRPNFREDLQQKSLILWGVWLLTMAIFFSAAGFFHQYYLTVMAPAVCALFGIGVVVMWNDYRKVGWRGWLLPLTLIITAAEQVYMITSNPAWGMWLVPVITIACALAALVLIVARLLPGMFSGFSSTTITRSLQGVVALSLAALLLTSAVWSVIPVLQNSASSLPVAGPSSTKSFGGGGGNNTTATDTALIKYLEANQGTAKYLVAVPSSMTADSIILETNKAVMALGGFGGSDPILTTSQLKALVANGTVRFFLLNGSGSFSARGQQPNLNNLPENIRKKIAEGGFGGGGPAGGGAGTQSSLTTWVTQNCSTVSANTLQSGSSGTAGQAGGTLYDCAAAK